MTTTKSFKFSVWIGYITSASVFFIAIGVILALLVSAAPVLAQSPDETSIILPNGVPLDEIVQALFEIIVGAVHVPFAATLIVPIVGLLKLVPQLKNVKAGLMTFALNVIFWIGWFIARNLHYEDNYQLIIENLTPIFSAVLGLVTTGIGAAMVYQTSVQRNVPVMGFQRTKPSSSLRLPETPPSSHAVKTPALTSSNLAQA